MSRSERAAGSFPIELALGMVAGKWKAHAISQLADRTLRFGQLERLVPDASRKVLVQQLRSMEAHGILTRTAHREVPPRVEYALTERGRKLLPILQALESWGSEVLEDGHAAAEIESVQADDDGPRALVEALDGRVDGL